MDQLKKVWAVIVKFHFWILTSLVLIMSVAAWYVSRKSLDEKVDSRISKLNSDFQMVSSLTAQAAKHPNDASEKEMDAILSVVTMNVKDAWSNQYERQKKILTWNRRVITNNEVHAKLDSYRPIELYLDYPMTPDKEPITLTYRESYRNYIKDVFPDLAKIIGARWTAQLGSASFSSGDGGDSGDPGDGTAIPGADSTGPTPIVKWSQASQSALQQSIVPWYNAPSPSTLEICYTQEDIWILTGILQVLKATNGNARENFQAPIKEVEWIKIGKSAESSAASMMVSDDGSDPSPDPGMSFSTGDPSGVITTLAPDPADNRYVDSNYKPVPASKLRAAMKSSNPEDAFFAVAKRVPVRFKVKMDQTKHAKLLAECGNGDLMIEVKQVRINAGDSGIAIGGGMGYDPSGDSSMMVDDGGGDDGSSSPGMGALSLSAVMPDPPIEIYGIIYLFNPVAFDKLGLEKVTENTTLVTTAGPPTAPPAAAAVLPTAPSAATATPPANVGLANPAPPAAASAPIPTPVVPGAPATAPAVASPP